MANEELQKRLEEIDGNHFEKIAAEWDIQKPVQFSMHELTMLKHAMLTDCVQFWNNVGEENDEMRALARKVDHIIEDMELELRDRGE